MLKIQKLILPQERIETLVPSARSRYEKAHEDWRKLVERLGMTANVDSFEETAGLELPALGNAVELPPFLRTGRLQIENSESSKSLDECQSFLASNDFPALLQLKTKSAFLHFSESDSNGMVRVIERNFLQLAATLDPSVVKCTLVDLENFGGTFSLLGSSIPDVEVLTSPTEVDDFFRELPAEFKRRSQVRGFQFDYVSDYNKANRDSSIPFLFIFVSSFESDLDENQKETLLRFISRSNAAKAGVYFFLLLHTRDSFEALAASEETASLLETVDQRGRKRIEILDPGGLDTRGGKSHADYELIPDALDNQSLKQISSHCREHLSKRKLDPVKLPLPEGATWTAGAWTKNSAEGIEVPIGKSRGEVLFFRLGCGEIVHNALVGGAVGTGKTNLLHAIIMQGLASYAPGELSVSILDYKSGTEFGIYEGCPHLYALSLGSGTKFGLDLLDHFQREMESRAEQFKAEGVSNMRDFRQKTGSVLARHLVVIDEFQVLLGDKRNGEAARVALEDLIRRGRSFGFNFVLSSQTLRDCSLTGATISNIGCRICLRLSERDCSDFLSVGNALPSTFEYPGQAVYNNSEGRTEGNVEFRSAFYPSGEIEQFLSVLKEKAAEITKVGEPKPFVYSGAAAAFKKGLGVKTPQGRILIALEDGIPQIPVFAELDASVGPVVAVGTGPLRDIFESNVLDELAGIGSDRKRVIDGPEIEAFCEEWQADPGSLETLEVLLFRPRPRDGTNFTFQNFLSTSRVSGTSKIVLFADNVTLLRNLCLDRATSEFLVCLDQRSYSEYGWDGLLSGQPLSAALFCPGENDPKLVKIPQI